MYNGDFFSSSLHREDRAEAKSRVLPGISSFFFHLRPRYYPAGAIKFSNTYYLGFFTSLFLVGEVITGVLLMVYYTPTPAEAYKSIQTLALVPFGQHLRDLHRLAGDLLVLFAFLHMLRVAVSGACQGLRRFTWITGILLFFLIQALAFSGYLLPWDQLSYWAVTVGTGLFGALPWIGPWLLEILRGGPEIEAGGLLRFYVLHVVLLPLVVLPLIAMHYYRIVRLHGISLPICTAPRKNSADRQTVPLWPTVLLRELQISLAAIFILIAVVAFAYDAPLGAPANPLHTPSHIAAPWFFLWAQGLLGICPGTLTALTLIVTSGVLLVFFPWYAARLGRPFRQGPRFALILMSILGLLGFLTFLGARVQQPDGHSPDSLLDSLIPLEGRGALHALAYDDLTLGVHRIGGVVADKEISHDLEQLLVLIDSRLRNAADGQGLANIAGVLIIEGIQAGVKRLTLRMTIHQDESTAPSTIERTVYRHNFGQGPLVSEVKK